MWSLSATMHLVVDNPLSHVLPPAGDALDVAECHP